MVVPELPEDEMAKLRGLLTPVYEASMDKIGEDNFTTFMKELEALRAK